jgi:hypothetical protein
MMTDFLGSRYEITTQRVGNDTVITVLPPEGEGISFRVPLSAAPEEVLFPLRDCFRTLFRRALIKDGKTVEASKVPETALSYCVLRDKQSDSLGEEEDGT